VKSQDTEAALDVIAPLVGSDTVVVSLQNGMNPPRIAERLGAEKVVAAFINFGADWQGPGHVEHGGPGAIYVGELDGRKTERLGRIQSVLSKLMTVHTTDTIFSYLWGTSSMLERVSRMMRPMRNVPRVIAGSTRCCGPPQPDTGRQRRFTENTTISMRPSPKTGID
jgi:hypothetical protein